RLVAQLRHGHATRRCPDVLAGPDVERAVRPQPLMERQLVAPFRRRATVGGVRTSEMHEGRLRSRALHAPPSFLRSFRRRLYRSDATTVPFPSRAVDKRYRDRKSTRLNSSHRTI